MAGNAPVCGTSRPLPAQRPHAVPPASIHRTLFVPAMLMAGCATVKVFPETGGVVATPVASETAIVRPGDTLYGIGSRYGITVADLAAWNGLAAPFVLHPGQRLRLSSASRAASPVGALPVRSKPARTPAWRWPAEGTVIERESNAGARGIDIVGTAGAPVRAVADGVVLYSGAGSTGYEEMIVIQHAGDWVSTYAHNRKRLVPEGRRVRAGERIAEMGHVGTTKDLVSIELRHNGAPMDPLAQLPPR